MVGMSTPAEIIMGEAALQSRGHLSESESVVAAVQDAGGGMSGDSTACWPDDTESALTAAACLQHETFLYCHLRTARAAELAMDRMTSWGPDYHHEFVRRRNAIAAAGEHYRKLRAAGVEIAPDLVQLALAVGLRP
jgi:hypothetical protein